MRLNAVMLTAVALCLTGCLSSRLSSKQALSAFDQDAARAFHGRVLPRPADRTPNHFCREWRAGQFTCETLVLSAGKPRLIRGAVAEHEGTFTVRQRILR